MDKTARTATDNSAPLRSVDQMGASLHQTIDRAVDPAHTAVDKAASTAHKAVDKLATGASTLEERTRGLRDLPHRGLDATVEYVQTKPLQAIGIAVAVGFLLGKISGGRSHY